jgi:hypothetical protein
MESQYIDFNILINLSTSLKEKGKRRDGQLEGNQATWNHKLITSLRIYVYIKSMLCSSIYVLTA